MQGRKASSVMLLLFDRFVFPSGGFPRGTLGFEALGCKLVAPPPKAQTWWVSIPAGLSVHFKWFHVCSTIVLLGICEANMGIGMFIYIDKVEFAGTLPNLRGRTTANCLFCNFVSRQCALGEYSPYKMLGKFE